MEPKLYTAIDLGSSRVICVSGFEKTAGEIELVGVGMSSSSGVDRGSLANPRLAADSLRLAVHQVEQQLGGPVTSAYFGVSGAGISTFNSIGAYSLPRGLSKITGQDVTRAMDAACSAGIPASTEFLHIIPSSYAVDGHWAPNAPVGEQGTKVEVKTHMVTGDSASLKALARTAEGARIRLTSIVYKPIASGVAVLRRNEIDKGVILADIGSNMTDVAVFINGSVASSFSIPVGGYHISNDLAVSLGASLFDADELKRNHGHAVPKMVEETELVNLRRHGESALIQVKRKLAAGLIRDRLEELFTMIARVVEQEGLSIKQPAGIVLTGGTSKLAGIADMAHAYLDIPARIGLPHANINGRQVNDPAYASAIGTIMWFTNPDFGDARSGLSIGQGSFSTRFKGWIRDVLPV